MNLINILYVEDEDFIRIPTSALLQYIAKNLFSVSNPEEALSIALSHDIDLIITDVNLNSTTSGLDLLEKIQEIKNIPSIAVSGLTDEKLIKQASKINLLRGYFIKPIDLRDLLDRIDLLTKEIILKKEKEEQEKLLNEYKILVDETLSVSKTDKKGIITYINDKFSKITGYSKQEAIGNYHNLIKHNDTKTEVFKDMWNTILNKKIWKGVLKNKTKLGEDYYVASTIIPILDSTGEIKEFISLRKNITDEINKEIKLNKENFKLNQYDKKINEILFVLRIDPQLNLIFCNHSNKYIFKHIDQLIIKNPLLLDSIINDEVHEFTLKLKFLAFHFSFKLIFNAQNYLEEIMIIGKNISESFKLQREIVNTQKDIILSLGTIGEKRSQETGNHVKRVAEFSYLLAILFGLSESEANLIKFASPMHDIGKVAIPDNILNKPARLTPEEFEIMKKHSELGFEMLKNSSRELLKASAIIAYEHHEKWNGTGYPRGLKEEQIHIYGRIVALADVYDALASERVYKKAWSRNEIFIHFNNEKGQHFDPILVELLLSNIEKFELIKNKYKD